MCAPRHMYSLEVGNADVCSMLQHTGFHAQRPCVHAQHAYVQTKDFCEFKDTDNTQGTPMCSCSECLHWGVITWQERSYPHVCIYICTYLQLGMCTDKQMCAHTFLCACRYPIPAFLDGGGVCHQSQVRCLHGTDECNNLCGAQL